MIEVFDRDANLVEIIDEDVFLGRDFEAFPENYASRDTWHINRARWNIDRLTGNYPFGDISKNLLLYACS